MKTPANALDYQFIVRELKPFSDGWFETSKLIDILRLIDTKEDELYHDVRISDVNAVIDILVSLGFQSEYVQHRVAWEQGLRP